MPEPFNFFFKLKTFRLSLYLMKFTITGLSLVLLNFFYLLFGYDQDRGILISIFVLKISSTISSVSSLLSSGISWIERQLRREHCSGRSSCQLSLSHFSFSVSTSPFRSLMICSFSLLSFYSSTISLEIKWTESLRSCRCFSPLI